MAATVHFDKNAPHADPGVLSDSEEDHPFRHMRTASVIVESGARVRRNITLAPDETSSEEDEHAPLLAGSSSGTGYSSVSRDSAARDIEPSRRDRFVKWLRSENPKRYHARDSRAVSHGRVFKCSLAYWMGSLAVFWTAFTMFLGKSDGMHIVATVAVYFHPARTIGSNSIPTFPG